MKKAFFGIILIITCIIVIFPLQLHEVNAQDSEFVCVGQFVTGDENKKFLYPEKTEYMVDQLDETYIYKFKMIAFSDSYAPEKYSFYAGTEKYICICMEKSFFDEKLNYEDTFLVTLGITEIQIELTVDEKVKKVPVLTNYDAESAKYMEPVSTSWVDWKKEKTAKQFHGSGYFIEKIADYEFLNDFVDNAGIYSFKVVNNQDNEPLNTIYVVCGENFYKQNREKGIEVLYASYYGLDYDGQPLWLLFNIYTKDYNSLRTWDLEELKSWYIHETSEEYMSEPNVHKDSSDIEISSDDNENNISKNDKDTIIFAFIAMLVVLEIIYIVIKRGRKV